MVSLSKRVGPISLALAFLLVALVLLGESFRANYHLSRASAAMGPAFYPRILLFIIIALAVMVIVEALRSDTARVSVDGLARVAGMIAITISYGILIDWIGFVIPSVIFIITVAAILNYRRWMIVLPVAVVYPIGLWLLFQKALLIILPSSPWFPF